MSAKFCCLCSPLGGLSRDCWSHRPSGGSAGDQRTEPAGEPTFTTPTSHQRASLTVSNSSSISPFTSFSAKKKKAKRMLLAQAGFIFQHGRSEEMTHVASGKARPLTGSVHGTPLRPARPRVPGARGRTAGPRLTKPRPSGRHALNVSKRRSQRHELVIR